MVAAIDNRMIKKTVEGDPDVTYAYYYNENWQVIEIRKDADTDPYKQFVWDQRYIDAPVVRFTDGNTDGDLDDTGDNTDHTLYYTNDANMNVTALVNTSGQVVERYVYDAYGRVTVLNGEADRDGAVNDWSPDADNTSDWDNELLYCGYRYDPTIALYHVGHRVYDPELGRWLQRDPLGYVDGMGLYEYCRSSQVAMTDPLGTSGVVVEGEAVCAMLKCGYELAKPDAKNECPRGYTKIRFVNPGRGVHPTKGRAPAKGTWLIYRHTCIRAVPDANCSYNKETKTVEGDQKYMDDKVAFEYDKFNTYVGEGPANEIIDLKKQLMQSDLTKYPGHDMLDVSKIPLNN